MLHSLTTSHRAAARLFIVAAAAALLAPAPGQTPLAPRYEDSAKFRWLDKRVLQRRPLDGMESLAHWVPSNQGGGQAEVTLTGERFKDGTHSLRLRAPTLANKIYAEPGRPFGSAGALRKVANEDWTGYNRISAWVYPDLPGFRVVSLLVVLHNDGKEKVPNVYGREGLDFAILRNHEWNHVVTEIAHLPRERVTGVEFRYRLQGNEPGATGVVQFDIDQLELQRVDPDYYAGWAVWPGRIAFSHSGYQPGSAKTALASGLQAAEFQVVRQADGQAVLTKPVRNEPGRLGGFQVMDFGELRQPGTYVIRAGGRQTQPFRIGDGVWTGTIRKAINFFFAERCGFDVPGSHRECHRDWQVEHDGRRIVVNGGWHDAGDLSQGIMNTSESVYSMLELADRLRARGEHRDLQERLLEEAKWGLNWVLKTSFGDGYRAFWATHDFWTNGIAGDIDDVVVPARNHPHGNFMAASAEAMAYRTMQGSHPGVAADSLRKAREDWRLAAAAYSTAGMRENRVLAGSMAVLASLDLYAATGERQYADAAARWAVEIVQSQQRKRIPGMPLTGFFYTNPDRKDLLHYVHPGYEQAPIVAMVRLCQSLPAHPDWAKWYATAALYADFLKAAAGYSAPYRMLPASLYREDEWERIEPGLRGEDGDVRANTKEQIANGIALGAGYRLRLFPVWHSRRGNNVIVLPQAKALSAASYLRNDAAGAALAERQLQWVVGLNPFSQSLMYGEGYDFAPQYTAMSGDIVGSIPVGIQSWRNTDVPYYSAMNCFNHKEVWVHPVARWISLLADLAGPAIVSGYSSAAVEFVDEAGQTTFVPASPGDGPYLVRLVPGKYKARSGGRQRLLSLLPGGLYQFDWRATDLLSVAVAAHRQGREVVVSAAARGGGKHNLELRAANLEVAGVKRTVALNNRREQVVTWRCRRLDDSEPVIAVVVPDGRVAALQEVRMDR